MSYKPVYYSKHTEEERSTITKTIETITKKTNPPETHNIYPTKASQTLLDKENWKSSGNSVINFATTATIREPSFDYSDGFFEQLIKQATQNEGIYHARPARVIPQPLDKQQSLETRTTYRDWQQLREKLIKDFEAIGKKPIKTNPIPYNPPEMIKKPLRTVHYTDMIPGSEKCKQQETKMTDKLKEIHEMVKDVKNLSEKFPKIFQKDFPGEKIEHTFQGCETPRNDITYISGIAFKINPRTILN